MRKAVKAFALGVSIVLINGCINTGLKVIEIQGEEDRAKLVGSVNSVKGAEITSYVTEIDGKKLEVKKGYYREYKTISYLSAGEHNVTVESRQGRVATASFKINAEAGKVYVAQGIPLSVSEMQIWISELNSSKAITDKLTVVKGKPNINNIGIVNELIYHHEVCKKYPENEECK